MKLEVSIGEAIDKLSILELKYQKIQNPEKQIEIQKEISVLDQPCNEYKINFYYKILMYINNEIWEKTDFIKSITHDHPDFALVANDIFELNQMRFRVKNIFNRSYSSTIKEQKSYQENACRIMVDNVNTLYDKIPEINYLTVCYECIYFDESYREIVEKIFKCPTIQFTTNMVDNIIDLANYSIKNPEVYDFDPFYYTSCGMLGDFILQLSVVNEKFLETGRKGVVYLLKDDMIPNDCRFRFGTEKAYEDTFPLVSTQSYIKNYLILQETDTQHIDYDLSVWRNDPEIYDNNNWHNIFNHYYGVNWGTHPWLKRQVEDTWKDYVFINTTPTRTVYNIDFHELCNKYEGNIYFITNRVEDYEDFKTRYCKENTKIPPVMIIESLLETFHIIANCKLFVGSLSAYLTLAHSVHEVSHIVGLTYHGCTDNTRMSNLDKYIPSLSYTVE